MKPCEKLVSLQSDCYIYSPSQIAKSTFFYPIYTGNYIYEAGYNLFRDSYDSILLMYIRRGNMCLELNGHRTLVSAGSFVLVDCYKPHSYGCDVEYECLWLHFDGPNAVQWYQLITSRLGNVITLTDCYRTLNKLEEIFMTFHTGNIVNEVLLSKNINDILTDFMLYASAENHIYSSANVTNLAISYINDHFADSITIEQLATYTNLSQYHFIRLFKKETGLTPYKYLLSIRIDAAKYLLKSTKLSIADICFRTGFSNVSVFCNSFKRSIGISPSQYRSSNSL